MVSYSAANSVRLDDAVGVLGAEQGVRLTHGSIYGRIWVDQGDFQFDVGATATRRLRRRGGRGGHGGCHQRQSTE
ncbi:MAG: hypothetical protein OEV40_09870 [Acidimicrobiia bacterium]|nr:hypothetical protein [Acidimicrobiia bacterium]